MIRRLVLVTIGLGLNLSPAGCATPELEIATDPADAVLFVDANRFNRPFKEEPPSATRRRARRNKNKEEREKREKQNPVRVPVRYYGTTTLSARQAARPDDRITLLDDRRQIVVEEPFSPWIFPLDFFFEAFSYPFRDRQYVYPVALGLAKRPDVTPGITPAGLDVIRRRARAARMEH